MQPGLLACRSRSYFSFTTTRASADYGLFATYRCIPVELFLVSMTAGQAIPNCLYASSAAAWRRFLQPRRVLWG